MGKEKGGEQNPLGKENDISWVDMRSRHSFLGWARYSGREADADRKGN